MSAPRPPMRTRVAGRRAAAPHPSLPFGATVDVDRRPMLERNYAADLKAWEARSGRRVTVRADGPGDAVRWRVDGKQISSVNLSHVVYGRMELDRALQA